MVRTGLDPTVEALQAFQKLQSGHSLHYIIFKAEGESILLEEAKDASEPFVYSDFVSAITTSGEPRYAVLDYKWVDGTVEKSKVCFILWCPDEVSAKIKMKYAGSKAEFVKKLQGIHKDIEAHDEADLEESEILTRCQS